MLATSFDPSLLAYLSAKELAQLDALITSDPTPWRPLSGPQTLAYNSTADIIGYGGAAGGGKTDLACGKALTRHRKSMILRRVGTELTGVVDRLEELLGNRDGYNGQNNIWRRPGLQIEFGAVPNAGDERKYQGRPHDFLCVGKGTPVRLPDGTHMPIDELAVGDFVDTLDGPRRITRVWPIRRDAAVRVTVGNFTQIQSATHKILTSEGWVCAASEVQRVTGGAKASHSSGRLSIPFPANSLESRPLDQEFCHLAFAKVECAHEHPDQRSAGFGACGAPVIRGNDCAGSLYQRKAASKRPLGCVRAAQAIPTQLSKGIAASLRVSCRDALDARASSALQGCQANCSEDFRLYDECTPSRADFRSVAGAGQAWILRPSDAGQPIPSRSLTGLAGHIPKHTDRKASYPHPYGKGIRSISGCVDSSSWFAVPVGDVELYDIEVEDANHYITGPGVINKNCFDEATNFLAQQVRFLLGWLRTTIPGQRCQALFTFNPPTSAEGRWVIQFFAPWLDKKHPAPASPGEIRWAVSLPADPANPNGRDLWVADGTPFVLVDGEPCYTFNPADYSPDDIIKPMSRTFIPSRITDNPYLLGTGYMAQLQALPEPLRSQMLKGDFTAGVEDDPWQVIPTAWVELAQARWRRPDKLEPMDSLGVDVARGGRDQTIMARRHGMWFDEPLTYPGKATPDGPSVAGLSIAARRDDAVIHIDVIGVGSSPYDFLKEAQLQVMGVNVSEASQGSDKSGRLRFKNLRSETWWKMREALDPDNNTGIALPPDARLLADLCAPTWSLSGSTIYVASREQIIEKIGRSPDFGSAYILALLDTPKIKHITGRADNNPRRSYDPYKSRR